VEPQPTKISSVRPGRLYLTYTSSKLKKTSRHSASLSSYSRRTFHPDAISDCGLRKAHKPQIPRFRKCIPIPVRHRSSTQQLEKLRKVLGLRTVHDLAAKRVFLGRLPSYYLLLTFLLSREGHKEARSVPSQLNIFALFGQGTRRDLKASFISSLTSNIKYFH
jgi:hypothetical protein